MKLTKLLLMIVALTGHFTSAAEKKDPLVGHWKSTANPEEKIDITKNDFGLDLWTRNGGRGRLVNTAQGGANVRFEDGRLVCTYYVSFSDDRLWSDWRLISGDRKNCFAGEFVRSDVTRTAEPSTVDRFLGFLFGKTPPTSETKPVELNKVPEGYPANGIYKMAIKCDDSSQFDLGEALFRYGISGFGFLNGNGQFSVAFLRLSFNDATSKTGKLDGQLIEANKITDLHFAYNSSESSHDAFSGSGNVADKPNCKLEMSHQ